MKIRDIKFRAWDKKEKKWRTDLVMGLNGCPNTRAEAGAHEVVEKWYKDTYPAESCASYSCPWVFDASNWYGAENIVLQQYTGVTDRNGKEIYEGDIVENEYGEKVVVEWKTRISSENWGHGETGFYTFSGFSISSHGPQYVIVGNIFESPEL